MSNTSDECKDCGRRLSTVQRPGPRCLQCRNAKKRADSRRAWAASILKKYRLSEEDYWRMYEEQDGRCALCARATGQSKRLAVDHDHSCCPKTPTCGQCTRGLACSVCNHHVIGEIARDDPDFFRRGYIHLTNGSAKRLGIVSRGDGE